jgi:hypothetical protein
MISPKPYLSKQSPGDNPQTQFHLYHSEFVRIHDLAYQARIKTIVSGRQVFAHLAKNSSILSFRHQNRNTMKITSHPAPAGIGSLTGVFQDAPILSSWKKALMSRFLLH